jgi:anthranilate phosphoribosyltransferase
MNREMTELLNELAASRDAVEPGLVEQALGHILDGHATEAQTAAFLMAMRFIPLEPPTLAAIVRTVRSYAISVPEVLGASAPALDVCGTGGDHSGSFNISTAVFLVAAGAGIPIVKHGNRSISSQTGSADVLEALGVRIDLTPGQAASVLEELGYVFLFAPAFHPVLRHVGPVRKALGIRTVFNLLGPLLNPYPVRRQLIGVYDARSAELVARTLPLLGLERGAVVHADSGLDELAPEGVTRVIRATGVGSVIDGSIRPADLGLDEHPLEAVRGGDRERNAAILTELLQGRGTPAQRDVVLLNAAMAISLTLPVEDPAEACAQGLSMARESLATGAAWDALQALANATRQATEAS